MLFKENEMKPLAATQLSPWLGLHSFSSCVAGRFRVVSVNCLYLGVWGEIVPSGEQVTAYCEDAGSKGWTRPRPLKLKGKVPHSFHCRR